MTAPRCNMANPPRVLGFEVFRRLCVARRQANQLTAQERYGHGFFKATHQFWHCQDCAAGAAIEAGTLQKLPNNVEVINMDILTQITDRPLLAAKTEAVPVNNPTDPTDQTDQTDQLTDWPDQPAIQRLNSLFAWLAKRIKPDSGLDLRRDLVKLQRFDLVSLWRRPLTTGRGTCPCCNRSDLAKGAYGLCGACKNRIKKLPSGLAMLFALQKASQDLGPATAPAKTEAAPSISSISSIPSIKARPHGHPSAGCVQLLQPADIICDSWPRLCAEVAARQAAGEFAIYRFEQPDGVIVECRTSGDLARLLEVAVRQVYIEQGLDSPNSITIEDISRGIGQETDPTGRTAHEPGAKLDAGKPRLGLVLLGFPRALEEVGRVGTYGAEKDTPNGWREVPNGIERYTDAMLRHQLDEAKGETIDPTTGLYHAAQAAWNALARLELQLSKTKETPSK